MKIRSYIIISSLALSILINPAFSIAEVTIESKHRVENRGYGVCAWASIEMAGNKLGVDAVKGLTRKRDIESKKQVKKYEYRVISGVRMLTVVREELRNNAANIKSMRRQLDDLQVGYESQPEGDFKRQLLYKGVEEGQGGAIIGIRNYVYTPSTKRFKDCWRYMAPAKDAKRGYHAVLLTDIDDDWVKFIDPNDISAPWIASRSWFDKNWDGAAMILNKPRKKSKPKTESVKAKAVPTPKPNVAATAAPVVSPKRKKITDSDIVIAPGPKPAVSPNKPDTQTEPQPGIDYQAEIIKRLLTDPKKDRKKK